MIFVSNYFTVLSALIWEDSKVLHMHAGVLVLSLQVCCYSTRNGLGTSNEERESGHPNSVLSREFWRNLTSRKEPFDPNGKMRVLTKEQMLEVQSRMQRLKPNLVFRDRIDMADPIIVQLGNKLYARLAIVYCLVNKTDGRGVVGGTGIGFGRPLDVLYHGNAGQAIRDLVQMVGLENFYVVVLEALYDKDCVDYDHLRKRETFHINDRTPGFRMNKKLVLYLSDYFKYGVGPTLRQQRKHRKNLLYLQLFDLLSTERQNFWVGKALDLRALYKGEVRDFTPQYLYWQHLKTRLQHARGEAVLSDAFLLGQAGKYGGEHPNLKATGLFCETTGVFELFDSRIEAAKFLNHTDGGTKVRLRLQGGFRTADSSTGEMWAVIDLLPREILTAEQESARKARRSRTGIVGGAHPNLVPVDLVFEDKNLRKSLNLEATHRFGSLTELKVFLGHRRRSSALGMLLVKKGKGTAKSKKPEHLGASFLVVPVDTEQSYLLC